MLVNIYFIREIGVVLNEFIRMEGKLVQMGPKCPKMNQMVRVEKLDRNCYIIMVSEFVWA
jgi:hypothetical protein